MSGYVNDNHWLRAALVRVVRGTAVLWRLRAVGYAVVPDHSGDPQPVIYAADDSYDVTGRKNVRSSARMNLFSSAKLKFAMPSLSARSRAR